MGKSELIQILDKAISREREATAKYNELAKKITRESSKKLFLRLAQEEKKHEEKLKQLSPEDFMNFKPEILVDLHLSEKIEELPVTENLTYLQALAVAIKKEEQALNFYKRLSESAAGETKNILLFLSQEESNHKFKLETEYHEIKNEYDWNVRPEEI